MKELKVEEDLARQFESRRNGKRSLSEELLQHRGGSHCDGLHSALEGNVNNLIPQHDADNGVQ